MFTVSETIRTITLKLTREHLPTHVLKRLSVRPIGSLVFLAEFRGCLVHFFSQAGGSPSSVSHVVVADLAEAPRQVAVIFEGAVLLQMPQDVARRHHHDGAEQKTREPWHMCLIWAAMPTATCVALSGQHAQCSGRSCPVVVQCVQMELPGLRSDGSVSALRDESSFVA